MDALREDMQRVDETQEDDEGQDAMETGQFSPRVKNFDLPAVGASCK